MKDIDLQGILEFDAAEKYGEPEAPQDAVAPQDTVDKMQLARVKSLGRGVDKELGNVNPALLNKAVGAVLAGKPIAGNLTKHLAPLLKQLVNVVNAGMLQRFFQLDKQAVAKQESIEEGECTCNCGKPICESCGKSHATESVDVEEILEGIDDIFLTENEVSIGILNQFLGPKDGNLARQAMKKLKDGEGVPPILAPALLKYVNVVTNFLAKGPAGLSRLKSVAQSFLGGGDMTDAPKDPDVDSNADVDTDAGEEFPEFPGVDAEEPAANDDDERGNVIDLVRKDKDDDDDEDDDRYKMKIAASKKYEEIERLKKLAGLSEAMSDAYGSVAEKESSEKVSYEKVHQDGDNNLTIQASANSMEALHDMLKLAGVDIEAKSNSEEPEEKPEDPEDHENGEEPEVVVVDHPTQDDVKGILINKLKDQLATKLNS